MDILKEIQTFLKEHPDRFYSVVDIARSIHRRYEAVRNTLRCIPGIFETKKIKKGKKKKYLYKYRSI